MGPLPGRKSVGGIRRSDDGKTPKTPLTLKPASHATVAFASPPMPASHDPTPRLASSWYNNATFSDITIKYGPDGASRFDAHRLVLANTSQWFELELISRFPETDFRSLTLECDFPDALDALFEFCYLGTYSATDDGETYVEVAKKNFVLHARVLIVADTYMADGLEDLALSNLRSFFEKDIKDYLDPAVIFKFAVEQVYLRPEALGLDPVVAHASEHDEGMKGQNYGGKVSSTASGDAAEQGHMPHGSCSQKSKRTNDGSGSQDPTEGFNLADLERIFKDEPAHHPLDRLKHIVVSAALSIWASDKDDLGREHLAVLVKQIPQFGTDLAAGALAGGTFALVEV
jgi:hypothetical protein